MVVYGGGNTAMDAARTAKRLGATDAVVVYRRTRERMPAHDFEVEEALDEGVTMKWLSTITQADGGTLRLEKMELDAAGFPQPTGEFEELEADSLVLALGQECRPVAARRHPRHRGRRSCRQVGTNMMTGYAGIFAGGDMVPAERTVTVGIGHGKKAARHIDAWLRGTQHVPPPKHELATFDKLNPWYYSDAPATVRPQLDAARRRSTFDEVIGGLDESNALFEARRCLSCGNCFACDNCYGVLSRQCGAEARTRAWRTAMRSILTTARAVACASRSVRAARWRWSPRDTGGTYSLALTTGRDGTARECRRNTFETRRRSRPGGTAGPHLRRGR